MIATIIGSFLTVDTVETGVAIACFAGWRTASYWTIHVFYFEGSRERERERDHN